jgi:hypothetical protein
MSKFQLQEKKAKNNNIANKIKLSSLKEREKEILHNKVSLFNSEKMNQIINNFKNSLEKKNIFLNNYYTKKLKYQREEEEVEEEHEEEEYEEENKENNEFKFHNNESKLYEINKLHKIQNQIQIKDKDNKNYKDKDKDNDKYNIENKNEIEINIEIGGNSIGKIYDNSSLSLNKNKQRFLTSIDDGVKNNKNSKINSIGKKIFNEKENIFTDVDLKNSNNNYKSNNNSKSNINKFNIDIYNNNYDNNKEENEEENEHDNIIIKKFESFKTVININQNKNKNNNNNLSYDENGYNNIKKEEFFPEIKLNEGNWDYKGEYDKNNKFSSQRNNLKKRSNTIKDKKINFGFNNYNNSNSNTNNNNKKVIPNIKSLKLKTISSFNENDLKMQEKEILKKLEINLSDNNNHNNNNRFNFDNDNAEGVSDYDELKFHTEKKILESENSEMNLNNYEFDNDNYSKNLTEEGKNYTEGKINLLKNIEINLNLKRNSIDNALFNNNNIENEINNDNENDNSNKKNIDENLFKGNNIENEVKKKLSLKENKPKEKLGNINLNQKKNKENKNNDIKKNKNIFNSIDKKKDINKDKIKNINNSNNNNNKNNFKNNKNNLIKKYENSNKEKLSVNKNILINENYEEDNLNKNKNFNNQNKSNLKVNNNNYNNNDKNENDINNNNINKNKTKLNPIKTKKTENSNFLYKEEEEIINYPKMRVFDRIKLMSKRKLNEKYTEEVENIFGKIFTKHNEKILELKKYPFHSEDAKDKINIHDERYEFSKKTQIREEVCDLMEKVYFLKGTLDYIFPKYIADKIKQKMKNKKNIENNCNSNNNYNDNNFNNNFDINTYNTNYFIGAFGKTNSIKLSNPNNETINFDNNNKDNYLYNSTFINNSTNKTSFKYNYSKYSYDNNNIISNFNSNNNNFPFVNINKTFGGKSLYVKSIDSKDFNFNTKKSYDFANLTKIKLISNETNPSLFNKFKNYRNLNNSNSANKDDNYLAYQENFNKDFKGANFMSSLKFRTQQIKKEKLQSTIYVENFNEKSFD